MDVSENDVMVLTFSEFLFVIIAESRIALPDNTSDLEESIAKNVIDG